MPVPRLLAALLLLVSSVSALPAQDRPAPVLAVRDLGNGAVALDGPWQFHPGDNPAWALPQTDDATGQNGWTQITASKPWGSQGFRSLDGYAWYRRHISLTPAPGTSDVYLQFPLFDSIAQIYWNGRLIASSGKMPPYPSWPADGCSCTSLARSFNLGPIRDGVLAIRVWLQPLLSGDSGLLGGFRSAPYIGSPAAITDREHSLAYGFLLRTEYSYALQFLAFLVGAFSIVAWFRDRSQRVLLWMALYCAAQITGTLVELAGPLFTYAQRNVFFNCSDVLSAISVWFLLLYLLRLDGNLRLMRWARIVALIGFLGQLIDSSLFLPFIDLGNPSVVHAVQAADWILTAIVIPCYFFPVAILVALIRSPGRLDLSRWILAISAFLGTLSEAASYLLTYGDRFTHWTAGFWFFNTILKIGGTQLDGPTIANTIFFLAVIYAALRYSRDSLRRQQAIQQELRSAQELQQVLVPSSLPSLPGFAITSSYRPAQEVGGDFFQIVPLEDSSALVVLGDVSGKGLRAAMAVSLIVGAVRTLARSHPHPAEILDGLNRELHGRLQGGFVTCLVLRLYPTGQCSVAAAGHPAPFLNGHEIAVPGAVPLGIETHVHYQETIVQLGPGDFLVLYTDGLLEARSATGEIFSFDRLSSLFSDRPSAEEAVLAGQRFGQEDDITVLTLTRLGAGEEAHTELIAPALIPA